MGAPVAWLAISLLILSVPRVFNAQTSQVGWLCCV